MIIGILLFTLGFFVVWFAKPNGATWRTVLPPEGLDRGPNADTSYRAVRLDGHERALKYTR